MPALTDITPGSQVHVAVTKSPTSAAATKTLVRLLSKDPAAKKRNGRIKRSRLLNPKFSPRGGRWRVWESRQPKILTVLGQPGETATIFAGTQELRELASVQRFIDVKPA